MSRKFASWFAFSVLAVLAAVALGLLVWINTGVYNVAATEPHLPLTARVLDEVMEESVRRRAAAIEVPRLGTPEQVRSGLHHFDAVCVTCHGAPGQERSEIGTDLLPEPPALSEAVPQWSPAELFWIVKHGIKMSGMPAFGPTHTDEEIWGIVALLRTLPQTTPEQYEAMLSSVEGEHRNDHRHQAGGDESTEATGGRNGHER